MLGSSEQTVARRYRRLRENGVIRVRGLRGPTQQLEDWYVRVQVRPGAASALATALAARSDVSWVTITAGGAEVVCATRPRTAKQRDALLLERLPRTAQVISLTAHAIMHRYAGSGEHEWNPFDDPLTSKQIDALRAARGERPSGVVTNREQPHGLIEPADEGLLASLHEDGRATHAQLASATGLPASRVARRLQALLRAGALYIDVEVANELLGFPTVALLWLTVSPSGLTEVAEHLAQAQETGFVAAVSGPANLHATVSCRSIEHLHQFLVREVGALHSVQSVETSPVARRVKQAGSIMAGARLPQPV